MYNSIFKLDCNQFCRKSFYHIDWHIRIKHYSIHAFESIFQAIYIQLLVYQIV